MACGGDVAELPIVWWRKEWMSAAQFAAAVEDIEQLIVHHGDISHEDDDDVTKREFEASFEMNANIAQTVSSRNGTIQNTEWIAAVTQGKGTTAIQVIEEILVSAWGAAEYEDDIVVVGEASGSEIYRGVTTYRPTRDEGDSEE